MAATVGSSGRTVWAVARRPVLWSTVLRQAKRLAPTGWWRRPPFWPRPDREYLAFRMEAQYGSGAHPPRPDDLVAYLEWCRAQDRDIRGRSRTVRR